MAWGTASERTLRSERRRAAPARRERPRELQDRLNLHVFHPLAWRLALRLAPTAATPDMVSIAGALLVVAAAAAYTALAWPWGALLGFALHLSWHVVDGADGDLARITGRSGPRGELIDGLCDYAGHVVLYVALGAMLDDTLGWIAWSLATTAGLGRIVQANHYESERRQYQWRVYGTPWLRTTGERAGAGPTAVYLALANRLAPHAPAIDAALAAADPARRERLRAIVRRAWLGLPRYLDLLRSNQRTLALGVSMLAGSPTYFFVYEAVALNLVLAGSIAAHAAAERAMAAEIEGAAWTR